MICYHIETVQMSCWFLSQHIWADLAYNIIMEPILELYCIATILPGSEYNDIYNVYQHVHSRLPFILYLHTLLQQIPCVIYAHHMLKT